MSKMQSRRLVLVGGGHSHAIVLEALIKEPLVGVEVHLIVDRAVAVYSGMVPGVVAGQYRRHEAELDVAGLAQRAGVTLHLEPMVGIDPKAQQVALPENRALSYDIASLDIGSAVAGVELEGVRKHTLPTRPIAKLLDGVDNATDRARELQRPFRNVVVGGGAGGVELAFCLDARVGTHAEASTTLVTDSPQLLPGFGDAFTTRISSEAARRGIRVRTGVRANKVDGAAVYLDDGSELAHDLVVWSTGAVGPQVFRGSSLPLDSRGFVYVDDTLRVDGHGSLFAAGDCATLRAHPETAKAGVYAVRQGPVLLRNLRHWLAEQPLESYQPQSDFLRLLNLGDGRALGGKWSLAATGRPVMWLKDQIDRRFMARFPGAPPQKGPSQPSHSPRGV